MCSRMFRWVIAVLACLLTPWVLAFSFAEVQQPEFLPVAQAFRLQQTPVDGGVRLHFDIAPGYYLYHDRFRFTGARPQFRQTGHRKQDPNFGWVTVHETALDIDLVALPAAGPLQLEYQGCAKAGLCYPRQSLTLTASPVRTAAPAAPQVPAQTPVPADDGIGRLLVGASLPMILLTCFALGLGLAFTPCVFPMVPILSSIIAGAGAGLTARRGFLLALAYVLGMALAYAGTGALMGYFGARANLSLWLQRPWVLAVFAGIFVVLALAMFGWFELRLPAALQNRLDGANRRLHGGRYGSVFVMGAASALVVSPCVSAPLAGILMYISSTGNAALGGSALFVLALGMGFPLLLIGAGGGSLLPRAGGWMLAVKNIFGVVLLGMALWLLDRVLPGALVLALWGLLLLGVAQALGLGLQQPAWRRMVSWPLAVWGILALIGSAQGHEQLLAPLAAAPAKPLLAANSPVGDWETLRDPAVLQSRLQQADRPVVVDIAADWCTACKDMDRLVFSRPEVQGLMKDYLRLRLDITEGSPAQQRWLENHRLYGPPALLVFEPGGAERWRLLGEVPAATVCARLAPKAAPASCAL